MDDQHGGRSREPHVWAPPDAGASRDAAVGRNPAWPDDPPAPDGPPPPPWQRQRRRRRGWFIGSGVAVLLAATVGLAVTGVLAGRGDVPPTASDEADGTSPDTQPRGDEEVGPGDERLDAPDLDLLDGTDAVFAQLLMHIDDSEQAMLGFQRELAEVFQGHGFEEDLDELFEALAAAGAESADRLEAARGPLEQPVDDVRAEAVREVYLEHLDSWLRYMRAVEADPLLLGPTQDDSARFTLSINATADAFARHLQEQLPDDAAPEVQRMAEQLLDRGFRAQGDADV